MEEQRIGERVAGAIPRGIAKGQVAAAIDLAADKFSRSLTGKRAFSAIELARLADVLDVDVHWLITGELDPDRIVVVARHDFDRETGRREVPGQLRDEPVLADVALAYRQAAGVLAQSLSPLPSRLPDEVAQVHAALGEGFVRPLADRIEACLDVDVVRLPMLSTAYSFVVGVRRVIAIPATGNWFRENWSLAHELAHLVLQHHDDGMDDGQRDGQEAEANAFAAELLLPASRLRVMDWRGIDAGELAERVWDFGVSTDALATRLDWLGVEESTQVRELLTLSTQKLLRRFWAGDQADGIDQITVRMDEAAGRRFPRKLQEAHVDLIAAGAIGKRTLAWMLGIDPDVLEVDEPAPPAEIGVDELASALGL